MYIHPLAYATAKWWVPLYPWSLFGSLFARWTMCHDSQFVERVSTRSQVTKQNFYSKTVPTPTAANATSGLDDHGNSEPVRWLEPTSGDDSPSQLHKQQWHEHRHQTMLPETLLCNTIHQQQKQLPLYHLLQEHHTPSPIHTLAPHDKPTCY
jgi:hypothetical protein